ncbi:unnamed protein product [Urochloa humidicola]
MSSSTKNFTVMSWNVRGLGDADKCDVVHDALTAASPSVICIQETKLHDVTAPKARSFLPPSYARSLHFIGAAGSRGGILTAWNESTFSLQSYITRRHTLTTVLSSTTSDHCITVTNVYAPSDHRDSFEFLDGLRELKPHIRGVWLLAGDFNLVRSAADKKGATPDARLCSAFNDALSDIGVIELPLLDRLFTWSNKRSNPVLARLDRVFVNNDQCTVFPNTTLTSLPRPTSDHTPILASLATSIPKANLFRFENAWLRNQNFLPAVLPSWHDAPRHADAAGRLAGHLKSTRAAAKVWARRNRAPPSIISDCKFIITLLDFYEDLRSLSADEQLTRTLCQERLTLAIKERAAYWKQRGKHRAVREGDSNTLFFHAQATQRMRRNHVRGIEVDGEVITSHDGKVAALTNHYKNILGTTGHNSWGFDLDAIYQNRPTASEELTKDFSAEEALQAVRALNPTSAPGPDGFGPSFYKAAWSTVGSSVMQFLASFQSGEVELERLNRSYMILIPKKPGATAPGDFRPICLQNCSVKIAAKALTTRLQADIPRLIDLDQTGFIKGRTISDNFVYATELVQVCYKRKAPTLVLKLDFAKAFNTVNWNSLSRILEVRGFNSTWRRWIRQLLSTSLTAVLVNGTPGPWFACRRGLRQGDPISPYLFLLVADVLQTLIKRERGIRHPLRDDAACPTLQYADDTLIVLRGAMVDVQCLKLVLDLFAEATGLHINYTKSTVVPMHMSEQEIKECLDILGCRREGFPQTYLGLPLSCTKLKLTAYDPYICRSDRYLAGWQAALLNPMGRTVLINAVLDGQLAHLMSAIPLPPGAIAQFDKRRRSFLWTGERTASGASCLIAWDKVRQDKHHGGLGVKDLGVQNTCLLLKLIHRLHSAASSSWAAWVREHADLVTMTGGLTGSHWESLRALLPIYQAITTVDIGDGRTTSFWLDVWNGDDCLANRFPCLHSHCKNPTQSVHEIITSGLERHLALRLTPAARAELLTVTNIINCTALSDSPDTRSSPFALPDGRLRTGPLYRMLKASQGDNSPSASFVWQNACPPRIKFFGWLLTNDRVQSKQNLKVKTILDDDLCAFCNDGQETSDHIMFQCSTARSFWRTIGFSLPPQPKVQELHLLPRPDHVPGQHFEMFVLLCCWQLWKRRNALIFHGETMNLQGLLHSCREEARLWACRLPRHERGVSTAWCSLFSSAM